MPKETFFNLHEAKRQAICQAALAEFAAHSFKQASINRIVAQAGIAKGSFYQYFDDKKDLFLYLLQQAGEVKMCYLAPVLQQAESMDFFSLLRELYVAGLRFAQEHPRYAAIGRHLLQEKENALYAEFMHENMPTVQDIFSGLLQQAMARCEIRSDIDLDLIAYFVASLNSMVVAYYTERVSDTYDDAMLLIADQFIELLKRGIAAEAVSSKQ